MLLVLVAAALRFWQLGHWPPGLYRDEAYNGLDVLDVLAGKLAPFFSRNNGREPAYIYLSTLPVHLLGPTALGLRLAAAVAGTLTTVASYGLAAEWFGRRVGLLAAWLWAVTVWPLHLSRIGLRVVLLPGALSLAFWLATLAYRRRRRRLWLAAGAAYGAAFYTYLAARFTPVLLLAILAYLGLLVARERRDPAIWRRLWPGLGWAALGLALVLAPLIVLAWQQPALVLGRSGQVSIFNPAINQGDFAGALWEHGWRAAGMFFWRGDTIARHNPPGRPLFDPLMAGPFVVGVVWCLRHWRRPTAAMALLWTAIMLGPTVLAEDTPHFLRAVGVLPAALLLAAVGLSQCLSWTTLPSCLRTVAVAGLLLGSLALGLRDYFWRYNRAADTAYWFEAAARDLAEQVNAESSDTTVWLEERLWSGWPPVQFLIESEKGVGLFRAEDGLVGPVQTPAVFYVWPHASREYLPTAWAAPAVILAESGSLARGDREERAYPLFVRYAVRTPQQPAEEWPVLANFDNYFVLRRAEVAMQPRGLQIDLYWTNAAPVERPVVVFVHLADDTGQIIAQDDAPPGQGHWFAHWWRPDLIVQDRHVIPLKQEGYEQRPRMLIGLYDAATLVRLPVLDATGKPSGDSLLLKP